MKAENTKSGNPYHDEKTGEFTDKNGANAKGDIGDIEDIDFDIENIDIDDDFYIDEDKLLVGFDDSDDIDDFNSIEDDDIDLDENDFDDAFDVDIEENVVSLTPEQEEIINSLNFGELEKELINSSLNEFDKQKIFNASPEELRELLKAEYIIKEKNKILLTNKELNEINSQSFSGLWMKDVFPSDYKNLKDNWIKKYDYFQNDYNGEDKNEKLNQLLKFKELGEFYESSYNEFFSSIKPYEDLLEKFLDPNSAYSEKRKNEAIWVNGSSVQSNINESIKIFGQKADQIFDQLKTDNPEALESILFYTGSYSIINEPLRKVKYIGYSDQTPHGFVQTVTKMSEAIDASTYDFDYWCQRGVAQLTISDSLTLNSNTDEETLKSLIGQTFKHQSFYSAGTAKNTGFDFHSIIINTYCPKGTKGLYLNTQGLYSGSDENEIVLQRGYSYKITKVEKKGGKIYLDVDTILNSDKEKYNYEELKEISKKYAFGK